MCQSERSRRARNTFQRMAELFNIANRVVAWIGPDSIDDHPALEYLKEVGSAIRVDWNSGAITPVEPDQRSSELVDLTISLTSCTTPLQSLLGLFRRDWFHRLWIQQEIRLANDAAILLCGSTAIPWLIFCNAIILLYSKSYDVSTYQFPSMPEFIELLRFLRSLCDRPTHPSFHALIVMTQHCRFTDPRDRVFAVLGMMQPRESAGIKADYTRNFMDVYRSAFIRMALNKQSLNLLRTCTTSDETKQQPTWVPNWSSGRLARRPLTSWASIDSKARFNVSPPNVLNVDGILCGSIAQVSDRFAITTRGPDHIEALRRVRIPERLQSQNISGGTNLEAICRTLCCDGFQHKFMPRMPSCPTLEDSKAVLQTILDTNILPLEIMTSCPGAISFLSYTIGCCDNRVLFKTDKGHFGLAPANSLPGDVICVFLGCDTPVVLRRNGSEQHSFLGECFEVVGECFVTGLSVGEALLGPLPDATRMVVPLQDTDGLRALRPAFQNVETGEVFSEDPRGSALAGPRQEDFSRNTPVVVTIKLV